MSDATGAAIQALIDPPRWGNRTYGGRDAQNLAACALVAAKVYEEYGWVRWDCRTPHGDPSGMHVPDAEALLEVLHDLACRALDRRGVDEVSEQVGLLRFIAYADDDGDDSFVNFYLGIGDVDASEIRALRNRASVQGRSLPRDADVGGGLEGW